ncbi:YdaU family protein [Cupriavidus respiraculi]|uniref:YdaU family protein n=1 Tax=Cupriavidus respiraculi TaxID=195930 RepID=UPI001F4070C9|nr:YdaU family protein [Cupriavidus respiraculi]
MNFYKRHIGDYIKDAAHLSLLEHGVYARLMDVYYTREGGIPASQAARLIGARAEEELKAVEAVLSEFFQLEGETWRQARCEREIELASAQIEANRANGKRGGRPKRRESESESEPTGFPFGKESQSEENPSHQPSATSHDPEETVTTTGVVVAGGDADRDRMVCRVAVRKAGPACPHQAIIALYHQLLPMCPGIREWTPARAQALRARWSEDTKRQHLDYWRRLFGYVAESDFLTGRTGAADGRKPFVASLDWIVKAENFAKIREGRYHGQESA